MYTKCKMGRHIHWILQNKWYPPAWAVLKPSMSAGRVCKKNLCRYINLTLACVELFSKLGLSSKIILNPSAHASATILFSSWLSSYNTIIFMWHAGVLYLVYEFNFGFENDHKWWSYPDEIAIKFTRHTFCAYFCWLLYPRITMALLIHTRRSQAVFSSCGSRVPSADNFLSMTCNHFSKYSPVENIIFTLCLPFYL